MTLVLTVATPAFALQVSDRLVSKGRMPHDPLANKTVVFRATDGVLVLGYTGAAFLEDLPTDTWIANVLSGDVAAGQTGVLRYGDFSVRDAGSSLRVLSERLRRLPRFEQSGGEISAAGWQWDGKRRVSLARNVLWVLQQSSGRLQWEQLVPRHIPARKTTFRMVPTGDWALTSDDWTRLLRRVGAAGPDWSTVESLLVDAIRQASAIRKEHTIGSHCMSVLLRPSQFPTALVRFLPSAVHQGSAFGETVEVAYSPWLVAPDAIHAPAVLVGGLSCEQGLLTYSMEAAAVPNGQTLKGAFQSQHRPGG